MTGYVTPLYEPAMKLKAAGVVPGHDLTSEAALAKLSYLLGLSSLSVEDVTRQMSESLRGELTEQTQMSFEHPKGHLSTPLKELAVIGYAIAQGNLEEVQDCLRDRMGWMLNESDYSGNTPLVSFKRAMAIIRTILPPNAMDSTLPPQGLHSTFYRHCCLRAPP